MKITEQIKQYEYILFDLGGVLIDIDYHATTSAFANLNVPNFDEIYSQALQTDLFDRFETGKISSQHFINLLLEKLPTRITPNEVVSAWNAMILDFQPKKITYLESLRSSHKISLLSNTNDIHMDKVRRKLKLVSDKSLEDYFDFTFLSQEIGYRKPEAAAFQLVCETLNAKPNEILFIDDSEQHIIGAQQVGMNTIHFKQNEPF
ncbi:MAG TPA: HAD family phosphatase [Taishania sp.]|nr:HAD family phosphatase [Taishania sp.]